VKYGEERSRDVKEEGMGMFALLRERSCSSGPPPVLSRGMLGRTKDNERCTETCYGRRRRHWAIRGRGGDHQKEGASTKGNRRA